MRLKILPTGFIYPKEERAVRDLLRKRSQLVRQSTTNILSLQNILHEIQHNRYPVIKSRNGMMSRLMN